MTKTEEIRDTAEKGCLMRNQYIICAEPKMPSLPSSHLPAWWVQKGARDAEKAVGEKGRKK